MGQQWERSLFCQFQLLGSHWEVHWLKLTPGLNRVLGGKTTPPNIFFRPILPKFEEIFEIVVGDFERWPMLPVRKTYMHLIWIHVSFLWHGGAPVEFGAWRLTFFSWLGNRLQISDGRDQWNYRGIQYIQYGAVQIRTDRRYITHPPSRKLTLTDIEMEIKPWCKC